MRNQRNKMIYDKGSRVVVKSRAEYRDDIDERQYQSSENKHSLLLRPRLDQEISDGNTYDHVPQIIRGNYRKRNKHVNPKLGKYRFLSKLKINREANLSGSSKGR